MCLATAEATMHYPPLKHRASKPMKDCLSWYLIGSKWRRSLLKHTQTRLNPVSSFQRNTWDWTVAFPHGNRHCNKCTQLWIPSLYPDVIHSSVQAFIQEFLISARKENITPVGLSWILLKTTSEHGRQLPYKQRRGYEYHCHVNELLDAGGTTGCCGHVRQNTHTGVGFTTQKTHTELSTC